ncbi:MAG: histidinol dehydrogenase, partial [Alphaproteobacteria bacterium]
MAVRLDNRQADFEGAFAALLASKREATVDVATTVADILADVRTRGDAALLELTARFDDLAADSMAELAVPQAEIDAALAGLSDELR